MDAVTRGPGKVTFNQLDVDPSFPFVIRLTRTYDYHESHESLFDLIERKENERLADHRKDATDSRRRKLIYRV